MLKESQQMAKQKKKKKNTVKCVQIQDGSLLSKNEWIEIHEEAYYRAMKRLQDEKNSEKLMKHEKEKWYANLLFVLNLLFLPWKETRFMKLKNHVYDNILVMVVSLVLEVAGIFLWLSGLIGSIILIITLIVGGFVPIVLEGLLVCFLIWVMGSCFSICGKEFGKEQDSNRIYAYSSCIIALAGCIISLIALLQTGVR